MYEYIKGKLVEKTPTDVVIDVSGMGYWLHIPVSTYSTLPAVGEDVRLLTYFVIREDAHTLYGFSSEDERDLFKMLLSVSGIGPKIGLTALSGVSIAELKNAIVDGAVTILTSIPGIGRKTAERIIVELREKLVIEGGRSGISGTSNLPAKDRIVDDSIQALISLGYRKQNAKAAIEKVLKDSGPHALSVEDLIRASLRTIS